MKGLTLFLLLAPYLASCATFSNQNLIVEKPPIVSEGSSATFQCELPIASSQLLNTCQFTTPLGGRLTVLDDQVVDSDSGQVVPGYVGVGWNRPGEICGIEVLIVDSSHMG